MISYSALKSHPRVGLAAVEGWENSHNILKDPPKGIMTRARIPISEAEILMEAGEHSGDRIAENILPYARGSNPMSALSITNAPAAPAAAGSNQNLYAKTAPKLPYRVNNAGAFRPPIVDPHALLPLSRQPRTVASVDGIIENVNWNLTPIERGVDAKSFPNIHNEILYFSGQSNPSQHREEAIHDASIVQRSAREQVNLVYDYITNLSGQPEFAERIFSLYAPRAQVERNVIPVESNKRAAAEQAERAHHVFTDYYLQDALHAEGLERNKRMVKDTGRGFTDFVGPVVEAPIVSSAYTVPRAPVTQPEIGRGFDEFNPVRHTVAAPTLAREVTAVETRVAGSNPQARGFDTFNPVRHTVAAPTLAREVTAVETRVAGSNPQARGFDTFNPVRHTVAEPLRGTVSSGIIRPRGQLDNARGFETIQSEPFVKTSVLHMTTEASKSAPALEGRPEGITTSTSIQPTLLAAAETNRGAEFGRAGPAIDQHHQALNLRPELALEPVRAAASDGRLYVAPTPEAYSAQYSVRPEVINSSFEQQPRIAQNDDEPARATTIGINRAPRVGEYVATARADITKNEPVNPDVTLRPALQKGEFTARGSIPTTLRATEVRGLR